MGSISGNTYDEEALEEEGLLWLLGNDPCCVNQRACCWAKSLWDGQHG